MKIDKNDKDAVIKYLYNLLNDVCKDVRETHVGEDVCGLCQYEADFIQEYFSAGEFGADYS